ncbi:MAG: hypothetical protein MRJ67_13710 [Nitrospirales bacterium]|nr:hypothetical protein [Nitrospira sp.]MDR4461550.1 hypothetical protein [Nitrospirales bacterium]
MVKEKLIIPEGTILLAESFSGLVALTLLEQCSIPLRGVFSAQPLPNLHAHFCLN